MVIESPSSPLFTSHLKPSVWPRYLWSKNQPANFLPATLSTKSNHTSFWESFQRLLPQYSSGLVDLNTYIYICIYFIKKINSNFPKYTCCFATCVCATAISGLAGPPRSLLTLCLLTIGKCQRTHLMRKKNLFLYKCNSIPCL